MRISVEVLWVRFQQRQTPLVIFCGTRLPLLLVNMHFRTKGSRMFFPHFVFCFNQWGFQLLSQKFPAYPRGGGGNKKHFSHLSTSHKLAQIHAYKRWRNAVAPWVPVGDTTLATMQWKDVTFLTQTNRKSALDRKSATKGQTKERSTDYAQVSCCNIPFQDAIKSWPSAQTCLTSHNLVAWKRIQMVCWWNEAKRRREISFQDSSLNTADSGIPLQCSPRLGTAHPFIVIWGLSRKGHLDSHVWSWPDVSQSHDASAGQLAWDTSCTQHKA